MRMIIRQLNDSSLDSSRLDTVRPRNRFPFRFAKRVAGINTVQVGNFSVCANALKGTVQLSSRWECLPLRPGPLQGGEVGIFKCMLCLFERALQALISNHGAIIRVYPLYECFNTRDSFGRIEPKDSVDLIRAMDDPVRMWIPRPATRFRELPDLRPDKLHSASMPARRVCA
jgi:hypothetical protein